jgi:hypothetical protein
MAVGGDPAALTVPFTGRQRTSWSLNMLTKSAVLVAIFAACTVAMSDPAAAQGRRDGSGPVATLCAGDIATYCAGLKHGNRAVRDCLTRNSDSVSPDCRSALDNTGGGRGMGRRWQ